MFKLIREYLFSEIMTESQIEEPGDIHLEKRIGKIVLAAGIFVIVSVIILRLLASLGSAYGWSSELVRVYDVIAFPVFVFGILFVVAGLLALLMPQGLSKLETWSLQTGPFR